MRKKPDPRRFEHITHMDSGYQPEWLVIGEIKSVPLSKDNRWGEMGEYVLPIEMDMNKFRRDPDPQGYMKSCIATHLAGCAANTGVPVNEGAWIVSINPQARLLNPALPKEFKA